MTRLRIMLDRSIFLAIRPDFGAGVVYVTATSPPAVRIAGVVNRAGN
jgi:hypothetical protein